MCLDINHILEFKPNKSFNYKNKSVSLYKNLNISNYIDKQECMFIFTLSDVQMIITIE